MQLRTRLLSTSAVNYFKVCFNQVREQDRKFVASDNLQAQKLPLGEFYILKASPPAIFVAYIPQFEVTGL